MNFIRRTVEELINKHNTRCPFKLADCLEIVILEYPFKKVKGVIIDTDGQTFIGVKSDLLNIEKRIIIAHEIGHKELHTPGPGHFLIREDTFFLPGKIENEASTFAAYLLLDELPDPVETIGQYSYRKEVMPELIKVLCYKSFNLIV